MKFQAKSVCETYRVTRPCSVEILLKIDRPLNKKDLIHFQFPNSWCLINGPSYTRDIQRSDPSREHFVSVRAASNCRAEFELSIRKRNIHFPEGLVRHGRLITARLIKGTVPAGIPIRISYENTFAPYIAEEEQIWIRVNNVAPVKSPILKVKAAEHEYFRIIAPSFARPGKKFEVLLVSLDRFDNASSKVFKGEKLSLIDGPVIAKNICFSGSLRVPVRIKARGMYRFRFREAVSNAVRISVKDKGPYWGDIHIHTKLSHDGQGTDPYTYAREVSGLDFAGVADHWESLGPQGYRILKKWAAKSNTPGTFVTVPADERNPREMTGHHNVYFLNDRIMDRYRAIYIENAKSPANSFNLLGDLDQSEAIIIPHHTGIKFGNIQQGQKGIGSAVNWDACDDNGLRPVMEIYSHHGQSEIYCPSHLLAYEWNRMRNPERRANTSNPGPFYAQDYWMQGKRIGVIASSDEHSGQGGRRHGGIAAVFAEDLTRKKLFKAIRNRRCYATTGERILVDFTVDKLPMGSVGKRRRGAEVNILLKIWGTDKLLRVDILRHRFGVDKGFVPLVSMCPKPESMDASISCRDTIEYPCLYYARVVQEPLMWPAMAWTSPVWIDVK